MSLLSIRAETLRANLNRINDLLTKFPNRWDDWEKLQTDLKNIEASLVKVHRTVFDARLDVETVAPEPARALKETEGQMDDVGTALREIFSFIVSMRQKCFQVQQLDVWREIAPNFTERIRPRIRVLVNIEDALQRPNADLRRQWEIFLTSASIINQNVFTEYIEFLGGLALRDTGFDTGISKVAEELISKYSPNRKNLAIPTRRQTVAMTLPRIIRVTFPDWTIWALPSTAHEFWNVVAKSDLSEPLATSLRALTENDDDVVESQFNDCLGDAFATYTMGPAYAFFAIYLLLDPSSPFARRDDTVTDKVPAHSATGISEESKELESDEVRAHSATGILEDARELKAYKVADEVRAHSIFQMLECMDSKGPEGDPPYFNVRNQISKAWSDAITQTGIKPKNNEKREIAVDKKRATDLVKSLWTTLDGSASPPFTIEVWNEIQQWVGPLIQGKVDKDAIKVPHGAELRHVLNAAWLARVSSERGPENDITKAATDLAKRITEPAS